MVETFSEFLFNTLGLEIEQADLIAQITGILLLVFLAMLANAIAKYLIQSSVASVIKKTRTDWDDLILEKGVITRLSHIVPLIVVSFAPGLVIKPESPIMPIFEKATNVYSIIVVLLVIDALLNVAIVAYERISSSRKIPLKGFVQAIKLVFNSIGLIFIVSTLLDKSPVILVSGLGAMTAVLLLVFRDPIMGLVAGIQLSVNNMVKVGDWIEMRQKGADGDVIDVSLTTVKVRNWDKTITTIPTHALIAESFKNWRGMKETGGRRIKRNIHIDMATVRFLGEAEIDKFLQFAPLGDHLAKKIPELREHNKRLALSDTSPKANGRSLTNVGLFRAYCEAWLRAKPEIHTELTFLVRQLQPTEHGLPIEIYVFTKTTAWAEYEGIQADIFDHLLSVLPEFGLSVYQNPSSHDLSGYLKTVPNA
ncbi:MAG: mechanosensitive ion channel domain-containing protein [Verrucomicrobiota bacterium]